MDNDKLISELKSRIFSTESLAIGLDQYDEIRAAIIYVIDRSSSYFKIVVNQKDPTHNSMVSDFFENDSVNLAVQHSKSMGVDIEVLSIHPNFQVPSLKNESLITFSDEIRRNMIKSQTDSEVIFNDKGDCLLFAKYKEHKKLPKNDFINLFSVDKALTTSIANFFNSSVKVMKGGEHG